MYIPSYLPYPIKAVSLSFCFIVMLYYFIRYHKNYDIWYKLIFCLGASSSLFLLLGYTIKEFQIFLFVKQTVDILTAITGVSLVAIIFKVCLPKALRNPFFCKLILVCAILLLICIIFVVWTLHNLH